MTDNASRIAILASLIKTNTEKIDTHLKLSGDASPSFGLEASPDFILPEALIEAQSKVLEACTELQALLEGPRAHLTHITSPRINVLMSLQAIYHYKIASRFPVGEEISFEELAQRSSIDQSQLRRLLRMATSNNIFVEPRKGVIAHTAISKLLAEEKIVHEWVGLVCDEMLPSACKAIPAMIKWPGSKETDQTGFALAHGESLWDVLKKNPERARRFADGMQYLQLHPAFRVDYLIQSLVWDTNGAPERLVDIGGSQGSISIALLRRYPKIKCYVQDVPEALHGVVAPEDLESRLHFSVHNFFTEQTIKNADVYLLRSILHDWSDKCAIQIIRNLIPALKDMAKVIVNEVCLPEPNTLPSYYDQFLRGYDLAMLQQFNSQERDAAAWEALFNAADRRFKLARIVSLPGSILSVIEFVWQTSESAVGV